MQTIRLPDDDIIDLKNGLLNQDDEMCNSDIKINCGHPVSFNCYSVTMKQLETEQRHCTVSVLK